MFIVSQFAAHNSHTDTHTHTHTHVMQELHKHHVTVESGLLDLHGQKCHWMTIVPRDFSRVSQVGVFFHGLGDHVGCNYQNEMLTYVATGYGLRVC